MITSSTRAAPDFCVSPLPCRYSPALDDERGKVLGCCRSGVEHAARHAMAASDPDRLADLVEEYGDLVCLDVDELPAPRLAWWRRLGAAVRRPGVTSGRVEADSNATLHRDRPGQKRPHLAR